jgi:predicted permease
MDRNGHGSSHTIRQFAEHAWHDGRYALRMIRRIPLLASVIVLSLGVGIGVNTAVLSWIETMALNPIPGVQGGRAFRLVEPVTESGSYPGTSWLEYGDLRRGQRGFQDLLAFRMVSLNVGEPNATTRASGLLVSGNYFAELGLRPAVGRLIQPENASSSGRDPVAVISYEYWLRHFDGSAAAYGQTIRVNGQRLTIIGVAPKGFQGTTIGLYFDLWVPATFAPVLLGSGELDDRGTRGYSAMGVLEPGATQVDAQQSIDRVMRQLARDYPPSNQAIGAKVIPFSEAPRGPQRMFVRGLALLQGVMILLLLAVCANTANLLLARASARQREMAVRLALGSGRWRVASVLLAETMILSLAGAALGITFAIWTTSALRSVSVSGAMPVSLRAGVDFWGLAFAIALGLACGLVLGLAPAIKLANLDPQRALRSGATTSGRKGPRNALMAAEVGLAVTVLIAAGLFFAAFRERERDPGFRREGVLLAAYDLTGHGVDNAYPRTFAAALLARLAALPGVESAAIASFVPLDLHGFPVRSFTLEGRARSDAAADQALVNIVTPEYFKTMEIPLRSGTTFADLNDPTAPAQAIVNEEFVRRFVSNGSPLGLRMQGRDRPYMIIGVVRNSLYSSFGEAPTPIIYYSYRDRPLATGEIHLRTRPGREGSMAPEVERIVRQLDPMLPVYDVRTLTEHVDKNLFLRRIPARLFAVLGPLLLMLAAAGIYAVVAYTVSQRTNEIGVRIALGASGRRVVVQLMRDTMRSVSVGVVCGWAAAYVVAIHVMRGGSIDFRVFLAVPILVVAVAALACWLPARRAASVDPVVALRATS